MQKICVKEPQRVVESADAGTRVQEGGDEGDSGLETVSLTTVTNGVGNRIAAACSTRVATMTRSSEDAVVGL